MTMASVNRAPRPSSLADVLDVVLDKGIVIDAYVRVAVVGIELLTIDARVVIASVDTYLRFAEAVNRLDLQPSEQVAGLPGLMDEMREGGAKSKTRGALTGVKEKAHEFVSNITGGDDDEDEDEGDDARGNGSRRRNGNDRRAPASRRAPQRG
jgi:gas vesicle structural protein